MSMVLWHHESSWVLMSVHSLITTCSWLLLKSHGCSLLIAHDCLSLRLSALWQSGILMASVGCLLVLRSANGCSWVLNIAYEHHSWEAINTHELGAIEQWTLMRAQKQSSRWQPWDNWHPSAFISTYGAITPYSWVLVSAHAHTWELKSTQESAWVLNCFIKL